MSQSPDRPIVLAEFPAEALAAIFLARLREHDVEAVLTGGPTAGFRAEVPGMVRVLVHEKDIDTARRLLDEFRAESGKGGAS